MVQVSTPRSSITAKRACRSADSGVVRTLLMVSAPMRVSTVPISPVTAPRACSAESSRYAVVVLPLVPVIPSMVSLWLARP